MCLCVCVCECVWLLLFWNDPCSRLVWKTSAILILFMISCKAKCLWYEQSGSMFYFISVHSKEILALLTRLIYSSAVFDPLANISCQCFICTISMFCCSNLFVHMLTFASGINGIVFYSLERSQCKQNESMLQEVCGFMKSMKCNTTKQNYDLSHCMVTVALW